MSTPDAQHELDTEITLSEIQSRLNALQSGEPCIADIEALTNKRSPAMKVLNRPAEARDIFYNNLLEAKNAFEVQMSAVDIGDTYRREGTPESFSAARTIFDSMENSDDTLFDLILTIHRSVAKALLIFARDNNSNPNREGLDILNTAVTLSNLILSVEPDAEDKANVDQLRELPLIRGILARAIQLYVNYSLRMRDMDTYESAIEIEKKHGLTPSNPNEIGNRCGTVAQHHFEQAMGSTEPQTALNWLHMCLRAGMLAQEKHREACTPAGYASALLGKILEARAILAIYALNNDFTLKERFLHVVRQIESGMVEAGAVQRDILASNAEPLIRDLEQMAWTAPAEHLRKILGLQS